jgi:hypothetical protein
MNWESLISAKFNFVPHPIDYLLHLPAFVSNFGILIKSPKPGMTISKSL